MSPKLFCIHESSFPNSHKQQPTSWPSFWAGYLQTKLGAWLVADGARCAVGFGIDAFFLHIVIVICEKWCGVCLVLFGTVAWHMKVAGWRLVEMTCLGSSVVDVVAVALCLKGLERIRMEMTCREELRICLLCFCLLFYVFRSPERPHVKFENVLECTRTFEVENVHL